jgi:hypothetical protein
MSDQLPVPAASNTFERIKRVNESGAEFWSSRDFAQVLGYTDYRNFEVVVERARTACFNSGQRVEDHFVEINGMIAIGKGEQASLLTLSSSVLPSKRPQSAVTSRLSAHPSGESRRLLAGYFQIEP